MKYYALSPKAWGREVPPLVFSYSPLDMAPTSRIMSMNVVRDFPIQQGNAGFAGSQTLADSYLRVSDYIQPRPSFFCERG